MTETEGIFMLTAILLGPEGTRASAQVVGAGLR